MRLENEQSWTSLLSCKKIQEKRSHYHVMPSVGVEPPSPIADGDLPFMTFDIASTGSAKK
jgi:hypothetical protein